MIKFDIIMSRQEQGVFMAEQEARGAGRYIAQFVPEKRIQTAGSIPEAILRAHVATEHTRERQGRGTTSLEPYLVDKYRSETQARKIIEELGRLGAGNLDVLAYRLGRLERGAGEFASPLARKLTTGVEKSLSSGGIQRELEDEALRTLHERAGSIVGYLRSNMTPAALERRLETHSLIGDPYNKYEVNVKGRTEQFKHTPDTRTPITTWDEVSRILQDLKSEGQYRLIRGYNHLADLFTGTLKGAQERVYLDSEFGTGLKRSTA